VTPRGRMRSQKAGGRDATCDGGVSTACHFGARRVGTLLDRLRLHLATQRFLARRRGDLIWEAGCDYGAMTLSRLESQLSLTRLQRSIVHREERCEVRHAMHHVMHRAMNGGVHHEAHQKVRRGGRQ